jgi:hypothetical protein
MFLDLSDLGQYGFDWICDTGVEIGKWDALYATTDTIFNTLTGSYTLHGTLPTLAAGELVRGRFTAITLTSGTLIAYRAKPIAS